MRKPVRCAGPPPGLSLAVLGLLALSLAACRGERIPIPALITRAVLPIAALEPLAIPPTYTPVPTSEHPTATLPPTATPVTPAATALPPTATPEPPTATPSPVGAPVAGVPARTACDGTGYVYRGQFSSPLGARYYRAYVPPCYGHDGRVYPVLYLFHGSVQSESHWINLGLTGHMDAAIREGRWPPFIVIMPFNGELGNSTSGGPNSVEGVTVNGLLPFVDANFCSWATAAGRGIGGISRGGYWALEIAFRYPSRFRSVSGHSSHLRYETDAATYNPLATFQNGRGLRIWLDWGVEDFLRPGQVQLRDSLANAGIPHEARENPGGHSDGYWRAHLATYLGWHAAAWPRDRSAYPNC